VEQLAPDTALDATGMHVPGARAGATLDIVERIGEMPYGDIYRARIDGIPVLATLVDPVLVGDARTLDWIGESLARAATVDHRNLTPCYGLAGAAPGKPRGRDDRCVVVQGHSDARQARQWIADRAMRGRTVELETARTVIGHLCNALTVLHTVMVHGYVGVDTVWLSTSGRVLLSDAGLGPLVSRSRRFARMHAAGRLPGLAPEQIGGSVPLGPGTDVFGLATLFLELVTGRPLPEAGAPLATVGLCGPDDLVLCLERATAPDLTARPPDAATFKAELADALPTGVRLDLRTPTAPARVGPPRSPTPPVVSVRPPAPLVLPPLAPTRAPRPSPPPEPAEPPRATAVGVGPAAASPRPDPERPRTPVFVPAPVVMPVAGAGPMLPGAPGAAMPVMMPNGVPAMGVVGSPVAGPGGYPAYVPVFVSVPSPPGAAPAAAPAPGRPRPTATDLDALDQLDRATRRIADAGAAEAVLELTEDVSQRTMRTMEVPAAAGTANASAGASASGVRVDLGFGEPVHNRTPTEPVPRAGGPRRSHPDRTPPPDGTYSRTNPDRTPAPVGTRSHPDRTPAPVGTRSHPDRTPAPVATRSHPDRTPPPVDRRAGIALDDEDVGDGAHSPAARYVLRKAGLAPVEHSLVELATMARADRLAPDDVLVQSSTGRQLLVADVPALREALRERGPAVPAGPRPPAPVVVPPMLITHGRRTSPLAWIALVIVVLGGLGVLAWWQLG